MENNSREVKFHHRDVSLDTLIEDAINSYEKERAEYWVKHTDIEALELTDKLADTIMGASDELVPPAGVKGVLWVNIRYAVTNEYILPAATERIQIEAARRFCISTNLMAKRCIDITSQILIEKPKPHVISLLRRLSRCYIAGFFTECEILCRALLENALSETYKRNNVSLEGITTMRAKLEIAKLRKWIPERTRRDAMQVWQRGSKAVHKNVESDEEVLDTIKKTIETLEFLSNA